MVPEISGLSVEEIDYLFKGSWFNAYKRSRRGPVINSVESGDARSSIEPRYVTHSFRSTEITSLN